MITKSLWFSGMLLMVCSIDARSQASMEAGHYKASLDSVFQAFKTKKYEWIKPLLDPQVKVDELPKGMNDVILPQILKQLPEPSSYVVASVVGETGGTRITTTYSYPDSAVRTQIFLFNSDHKIIEMDVLNDAKTVTTKSACAPEQTIKRDIKKQP